MTDDLGEFFRNPSASPPDAYGTVRAEVLKHARASGAQIRERPAWPGSSISIRYAEPLAGIGAAVAMQNAAVRVAADYVKHAREDGTGWLDIGKALGLDDGDRAPYEIAAAAFEWQAGDYDLRQPAVYWKCRACGQGITDRGPYDANPADCEEGHAEGCTRLAAEVEAYDAQWKDEP